jgi:hypothetical protein
MHLAGPVLDLKFGGLLGAGGRIDDGGGHVVVLLVVRRREAERRYGGIRLGGGDTDGVAEGAVERGLLSPSNGTGTGSGC